MTVFSISLVAENKGGEELKTKILNCQKILISACYFNFSIAAWYLDV